MSTLLKSLSLIESSLEKTKKNQEAINHLKKEIKKLKKESPSESSSSFPLPKEIKGNDFAIFSDGGCRGNPGPGSWGAMGQNSKGEVLFEISSFDQLTTNNKMELKGALEAIKNLKEIFKEKELSKGTVYLFSDSNYVIQGLNSWRHNWKKRGWKKADKKTVENKELWVELDKEVSALVNFKGMWVKGHSGHPQNERCDRLCNEILDRELL